MENLEVWKDVVGYEGSYQVSSLGNVKSLERLIKYKYNFRKINERILNPGKDESGYLMVSLCNKNIQRTFKVHKLVATAFLNHTPCGYKLVVNHINFIRTDNRLENLEIVTMRENCNHKHITSSSKYTGVCWLKNCNKWQSSIYIDRKLKVLGYFYSEEEASLYYENALIAIKNKAEIKIQEIITSSKHKGISWDNTYDRWIARVNMGGKRKYLGCFKTEIEAVNIQKSYYLLNKNIL